jgi:hypothetical protein
MLRYCSHCKTVSLIFIKLILRTVIHQSLGAGRGVVQPGSKVKVQLLCSVSQLLVSYESVLDPKRQSSK